jgi:Flp pilus assembly pilin Flp
MEYALLGVLIGIALIVSIQNLSNMIIEMYNTITTAFP